MLRAKHPAPTTLFLLSIVLTHPHFQNNHTTTTRVESPQGGDWQVEGPDCRDRAYRWRNLLWAKSTQAPYQSHPSFFKSSALTSPPFHITEHITPVQAASQEKHGLEAKITELEQTGGAICCVQSTATPLPTPPTSLFPIPSPIYLPLNHSPTHRYSPN